MALQNTRELIRAALRTDPTISPDARKRVLLALADRTADAVAPAPRVLSFPEAAARLACGKRLLHRMARAGQIRKVKLPGRVRCRGILESDLEALLTSGVQFTSADDAAGTLAVATE